MSRGRRTLPTLLAALCFVLVAVVAVLGWRAATTGRAESARSAALEAARSRVPLALSYHAATLEANLATAREQLATGYLGRFQQLADQAIIPAARQRGMSSTLEVRHAAVSSLDPRRADRAEVLVVLHQRIDRPGQPKPTEDIVAMLVTVVHDPDGRWLISDLRGL